MQSFRSMLCAVVALGLVSTSLAACSSQALEGCGYPIGGGDPEIELLCGMSCVTALNGSTEECYTFMDNIRSQYCGSCENSSSFNSVCGINDDQESEEFVTNSTLFCSNECSSAVTDDCQVAYQAARQSYCVSGNYNCPKDLFPPTCNPEKLDYETFVTSICSGGCLQAIESNATFSNTDCAALLRNEAEQNCATECKDTSFFSGCGVSYNPNSDVPRVENASLLCSDVCLNLVDQSSWVGCKVSLGPFKAPYCRLLNEKADSVNRVITMRLAGDLNSANDTQKAAIIDEVTVEIVNATGLSASKFSVVLTSGSILVQITFDNDVDTMDIAGAESVLSLEQDIGDFSVEGFVEYTTASPSTPPTAASDDGNSSTTTIASDGDNAATAIQHGFAIVVAAVVAALVM